MENTDIDMVISIPDTPDRPVRRASLTREVNKRPRSPEAPVRFQREEHRHHLNGRARPVSEASDTQTDHGGHRSRASGSNALFRRTAVEKDKGKSICIDPSPARVEKGPVVNQRNGHALFTTSSRCLPSEDVRETRTSNVGSSPNKGKGIVDSGDVSNRETINLSSERKPIRGTRRLVRNGCISPHGIAARAREATDDTNSKDTASLEQELALEAASSIDIKEIVSDNHMRERARGKRPEISPSRVASRDAPEGWVSTRSRSLNIDHEMDRRDESDTRGTCSFVSRLGVQETSAVDREARPKRRRKNGVTPSRVLIEPQVSVIGEPSSSRPQSSQRQGTQVLEIEDSSPEVRVSRAPRRFENDESDVKARQIEADARLARELQEQLYEESTLLRNEQMDETIARLMEQEENSLRASSSRASTRNTRSSNTIAADQGGSSRVEERPQQHSSRRRVNTPQARHAAVRLPSQPRGRRLGRAPVSLHRAMNFSFPRGMGLDSRMDFLENLENVIGHSINNSNLLHMDRDFTEDDYELLLALDENNHQHGGASTHRINNLPESTVQSDNFQETCVICLETPTIGDTIRHLPCFHKFHKDCIDPWLGRSKACPVCKSSVT